MSGEAIMAIFCSLEKARDNITTLEEHLFLIAAKITLPTGFFNERGLLLILHRFL